jgi:hypothetical protein
MRALRGLLVGGGVAAVGWGAWLLLDEVPAGQWLRVGLWLALGVAVHDGLLAPAATVLGRAARPWLPAALAPALRAAWLAGLSVLLLGVPLLVGARDRANPTVIPGHPLLAVAAAAGLLLLGCAAAAAVAARRAPRRSG